MPVKGLLKLSFIAASMVASATAFAQEQPRSMLGDFDLKSVVLSPAPLGPPSQFERFAAEPTSVLPRNRPRSRRQAVVQNRKPPRRAR